MAANPPAPSLFFLGGGWVGELLKQHFEIHRRTHTPPPKKNPLETNIHPGSGGRGGVRGVGATVAGN